MDKAEKTLNLNIDLANMDRRTIKLITMQIWKAYYQVRRIKRRKKRKKIYIEVFKDD